MKTEFKEYLESIGLTEPIQERIDDIFTFYNIAIDEEIEDIFVSEYVKEDKSREYENFSLFSKSYVLEAKNFINNDNYDLAFVEKILYWELQKSKYDFHTSNDQSRLTITVQFNNPTMGGVSGIYKASGNNCDALKEIFIKHIKPKIPST